MSWGPPNGLTLHTGHIGAHKIPTLDTPDLYMDTAGLPPLANVGIQEIEPDSPVPMVLMVSPSSSDEAIAPSLPSPPDYHGQHQKLLQKVGSEIQIPLDSLQPSESWSGDPPSKQGYCGTSQDSLAYSCFLISHPKNG